MNNILLLGAGFSENRNGRLASEIRSDLQTQFKADDNVSRLLQNRDFETVLSIVQDEFNKRPSTDTERRLRAMQGVINEIFSRMNLAFQRLTTLDFSADMNFSIRNYLACFDAIFTLNQDMLLELVLSL